MKILSYISNSYEELKNKVSWPTWDQIQSSSVVVAVASLIIALIVFGMDKVFSTFIDYFLNEIIKNK
tara:strand:- start:2090 stop:2290 length:201 start_codon:yes stop_codon:yes gene_type:complete